MRTGIAAAALAAFMLGAEGCGSYGGVSPTGPDGLPSPPAGALVINVVANNGAQSFSPNPATIPAGQMVSWHNTDTIDHHVVLDNGRLDTGNISAGRFSPATTLPAAGGYHCSIHPPMVGTLVAGQ